MYILTQLMVCKLLLVEKQQVLQQIHQQHIPIQKITLPG
jgi:hypothetical protein